MLKNQHANENNHMNRVLATIVYVVFAFSLAASVIYFTNESARLKAEVATARGSYFEKLESALNKLVEGISVVDDPTSPYGDVVHSVAVFGDKVLKKLQDGGTLTPEFKKQAEGYRDKIDWVLRMGKFMLSEKQVGTVFAARELLVVVIVACDPPSGLAPAGTVKSAAELEYWGTAASWALGVISTVFALMTFWVLRGAGAAGARQIVFRLSLVSMIFLIVGLAATGLTVEAVITVPVLGSIVLDHDARSIATTIYGLFESGNHLLAILIGVFSIGVPVMKLVLSVLCAGSTSRHRDSLHSILVVTGKWSMADVFVVGVLLAFLALNSHSATDAWVGPGLYFFIGYCLLSMLLTYWIPRAMSR